MTRDDVTRRILSAKRRKGLGWRRIAGEIGGGSVVYLSAALLGQMTLGSEEAERAAALFELGDEEKLLCRRCRIGARCRAYRRAIR